MTETASDDQLINFTRKRTRRNAIKPNSAESLALHEFSIMHSLKAKTDLNDNNDDETDSEKRRRLSQEDATLPPAPAPAPASSPAPVPATSPAPVPAHTGDADVFTPFPVSTAEPLPPSPGESPKQHK
jgi:hypothetical protein